MFIVLKLLILLIIVIIAFLVSGFGGNKIHDTADRVVKVYTEEEKEQEEIDKNE